MPKSKPGKATASRKKQHVELTLRREVGFRAKTTGLERWEFTHNALPEINLSAVDTRTVFLDRPLDLPFLISCMTGGYADALKINRALASVCEEKRIALGVGSQRQALEDPTYHRSFSVVREAAPSIPVIGNIGAAEVAAMRDADAARRLVDLVRADAFAVHLNPVQEFLQPEGNTNFAGVARGIGMLIRSLDVPVIVKEIGAGISPDVARRLLDLGVRLIDVAGAGGTSWAGVESLRGGKKNFSDQFWDWGIGTAEALRGAAALRSAATPFTLIASGGIASGMEAAKCLALGADLAGSARPMLAALHLGGTPRLRALIGEWERTLRGVMFLTGAADLAALRAVPMVERSGA